MWKYVALGSAVVFIGEEGIKEYYDSKFFMTPANEPIAVSVFKSNKDIGYKVHHLDNPSLNYTGTLSAESKTIANKYKRK